MKLVQNPQGRDAQLLHQAFPGAVPLEDLHESRLTSSGTERNKTGKNRVKSYLARCLQLDHTTTGGRRGAEKAR